MIRKGESEWIKKREGEGRRGRAAKNGELGDGNRRRAGGEEYREQMEMGNRRKVRERER